MYKYVTSDWRPWDYKPIISSIKQLMRNETRSKSSSLLNQHKRTRTRATCDPDLWRRELHSPQLF